MHAAAFLLSRLAVAAAMLMLAVIAHPAPRAAAQGLDQALARFAADSFPETEQAIGEIARSGHPRAETILQALNDRRLLVGAGGAVLIREPTGAVTEAASGQPAEITPAHTPVRINNRLRAALQAALGTLTLTSPDPARRLAAANSVARSRDLTQRPAVESALARESDGRVRAALVFARSVLILNDRASNDAERFGAIEALAERGDQTALGELQRAHADLQSADVRAAAAGAIARVEARLKLIGAVQTVWYGLSLGSVLLLAAIGLAITFGVMGVINMAHGEMVMLGAYTTFAVQEAFRAYAPEHIGWSLPLALPLAFLVAGLVGIAIERGIIRFLYGRPLETLLATWGVSLFLQQLVRTTFGSTNREVSSPAYMSGSFEWMGLQIAYGRLAIIVLTLVLFALLLLALHKTPLGLQMRAVTQNRRMASAMGIRTPWVDAMTFGLGSGIAGIAGVALSQIDNVSPNLGQGYIIDSFMVVVFGGVGNLWGTLVSAFALGIANKIMEPLAGAVLAKIVILAALILFIQMRPRGLFALKGRAVEA